VPSRLAVLTSHSIFGGLLLIARLLQRDFECAFEFSLPCVDSDLPFRGRFSADR
jgi:hypothetical protein